MVEILDKREDYGEDRWLVIAMVEGELLSVRATRRAPSIHDPETTCCRDTTSVAQ